MAANSFTFPGISSARFFDSARLVLTSYNSHGLFLPAAYIGFGILHGKRAYLGDDTPAGWRGVLVRWGIFAMTALLVAALGVYVWKKASA